MASTPGLVTSNVVGSTYHPQTAEEAAMERMELERQWELEDRNWGLQREADEKALAEWQKNEDEAKMREAYEKFYAPMAQSQWDQQQGKIIGAEGMASGDPRMGSVYKKTGPYPGQQPYEYRPDTNMPADQYQQGLDYAYEMWKAGQMMGAGDWKVQNVGGRPGGGSGERGGGTYSGNVGGMTRYEY